MIFAIAILVLSVVAHEVSHGYAAYIMGDPTAKYAGRLSLNPIKHLDMVGSFLVPFFTYFFGGFIIGWAKPVPYNPYNLRNQRWGEAIVGFAGPSINFLIALVFGMFLRFSEAFSFLGPSFFAIVSLVVFINVLLMVFNLVPIPPLDGSKLLFAILPDKWHEVRVFLERHFIFVLLFFLFVLWRFILPIVKWVYWLITGSVL